MTSYPSLSSWKALELVDQLLSFPSVTTTIKHQLKQQHGAISAGGSFTVRLELDLFQLFTFNSVLGSWMLEHATASQNLWRRAIFIHFEHQLNLWTEDQIRLVLLFYTLPIAFPCSLAPERLLNHYASISGFVTAVADPFIELFPIFFKHSFNMYLSVFSEKV